LFYILKYVNLVLKLIIPPMGTDKTTTPPPKTPQQVELPLPAPSLWDAPKESPAPKAKKFAPVFKAYTQAQPMLPPQNLGDLVPKDHPVRIAGQILDKIDKKPPGKHYVGGGSGSYSPVMLLKVVVFAYINNIYSSRKIEEAVRHNALFMWLAGMATPGHNTINSFRGKGLQGPLKEIFGQAVKLPAGEGTLCINDVYTDGAKIGSAAGRYTFVWGNGTKANRGKIAKQLEEVWEYAQGVADKDAQAPAQVDFGELDGTKLKEVAASIDEALKDKKVGRPIRQKLEKAKKKWPGALDRYAAQEAVMGEGRNSYSKTDTDAAFMRMKEGHPGNGQLKPAYNVQISTNEQFIVNYSAHSGAGGTTAPVGHVEGHKALYGQQPAAQTADAGYGSGENLAYLEKQGVTAYVKYNNFDNGQGTGKKGKNRGVGRPFAPDKLFYNKAGDFYVCPMGQRMERVSTGQKATSTGYVQEIATYRAKNCGNCPLRGVCHDGAGEREIDVNHNPDRLRAAARENLCSDVGTGHRKRRGHEVGSVFGNIKGNHGYRRFLLRGRAKAGVEVGLLSMAQDFRKKCAIDIKKAA
jgi:transposase